AIRGSVAKVGIPK
ncbi:hypothetical protein D046_7109B, partial [Vibrio parahaemolyticus V-223/04]